jgi:hypothetical protein
VPVRIPREKRTQTLLPVAPLGAEPFSLQHRLLLRLAERVATMVTNPETPETRLLAAQRAVEEVWALSMIHVVRYGALQLPGGLGSFRMVRLKPGKKHTPGVPGSWLAAPRAVVKFQEGQTLRFILGRPDKRNGSATGESLLVWAHALRAVHQIDVVEDADVIIDGLTHKLTSLTEE